MTHASALPPGGALGSTRRGWNAPANRVSDAEDLRQKSQPVQQDAETPDPYADERKWPGWAVTLGVLLFCGAFWAGVSYIVTQLLG